MDFLEVELLLTQEYPFLSNKVYGDTWELSGNVYFIPVPNRSALLKVNCVDHFKKAVYFMAEPIGEPELTYDDYPSIGLSLDYRATGLVELSTIWASRMLIGRRAAFSQQRHNVDKKPFGETGILYKCIPGKTYIIQDCYWGTQTVASIPVLEANKRLEIMADGSLPELQPDSQER